MAIDQSALSNPVPLRQRLFDAADSWTAATGRSQGALSSAVVNSGKALDDLASGKVSAITDATLERFARFLAEPDNWPGKAVSPAAVALAAAVGIPAQVTA